MGLISVIVPIYNAETYLDKCISSILNQTYKMLELILINDGSTDSSLEICQKWQEKDNRVVLVNRENKGVSESRNEGIEIAKGKYISFVDADDYLDKNCFQMVMDSNEANNYDIVVFNYYLAFPNNNIIGVTGFENDRFEYEILRENGIRGFACNKVYKAEIINQIRFDKNIKVCEDLLFNFEVSFNNLKLKYYFIDKPLYYYFQNRDSACSKKFYSDLTKFIAYERIISMLEKYDNNYCKSRKLNYIIDFNDFKLINKEFKAFDTIRVYKTYKKYIRELLASKISVKDMIKIFLSCHLNKIYYRFRKKMIKYEEDCDINNK